MQKILVIGSGGSGKSTLATRLGEKLNLPVIHLDAHFWNAGWVATPEEEWRKKVEALIQGEAWIMDGNFSHTFDLRFPVADTVIFLDTPRLICLWRVIKRWLYYSLTNQTRPDLAAGCPEQMDWEFYQWVWNYPERTRPKTLEMMEKYKEGRTMVVLRSKGEVEKFLIEMEKQNADDADLNDER
jgi:adenylate kinase family enzyme